MPTASLKQRLPESFETERDISHDIEAVAALRSARYITIPYKHWLFQGAVSDALCHEIITLPIAPPAIHETYGKRDSHNELRNFFTPALQENRYAVRAVANIFQSEPVVRCIEKLCGITLGGSYLRIEYCQDRNGFWLEPHMDIKEKLITMQIYLNTGPGAQTLGTDIYDRNKRHHSSAPSALGQGMIFIPSEPGSWHGFEQRLIPDVRRSLIVNYVTDEWRARHELAFPERPIAF